MLKKVPYTLYGIKIVYPLASYKNKNDSYNWQNSNKTFHVGVIIFQTIHSKQLVKLN